MGSNFGLKYADIGAPGRLIMSSTPPVAGNSMTRWNLKTGSSMATPMVSGIGALVLSVLGTGTGNYFQVRRRLGIGTGAGDLGRGAGAGARGGAGAGGWGLGRGRGRGAGGWGCGLGPGAGAGLARQSWCAT